jgi:hypothetical protein
VTSATQQVPPFRRLCRPGCKAWQEALSARAKGTSLYCYRNSYYIARSINRNYYIATICHDKVAIAVVVESLN